MEVEGIEPYTHREEAEKHVLRWMEFFQKGQQIRFALKLKGETIGTCGLYLINKRHQRACMGYDLHPDFQGWGYATEAVEAMVVKTAEMYNLRRIQAEVLPDNSASVKLLERVGFKKEGLLTQYEKWGNKGHVDLLIYARLF